MSYTHFAKNLFLFSLRYCATDQSVAAWWRKLFFSTCRELLALAHLNKLCKRA